MKPARIRTLRPSLHLLETEMEGFDVRAAVIVSGGRAVVWDALAHPAQMASVRALVGDRLLTVVYSHADWDHAWGACGLGGVEEVVAHEAAADRFYGDVREELARRMAEDPEAWRDIRLIPPTRTFREPTTVDVGGAMLELYELPGHTSDSIVGFVPEWGVLLAGDAVENPLPFVNDAAAVAGWLAHLARWRDDARVTTVIPAHGPVGGLELLDRTAAYLRALTEGREPPVPSDLPPFYRETHERNIRLVG